ncbi:Mitotic spindle assembly checkpoint protein MAD1 [Galemys pyrenaicus]|uniref:Mitotic spindle assembly checkpoint protein MAD1 n=1 Tax=Galemys pyrenaicus TaxID=202257 RepID=A0A8J6DIZ4_GALPY|nr:Mitotic spindle assembly checkpoint protein MAD1 [Galemys pyrenaicus]
MLLDLLGGGFRKAVVMRTQEGALRERGARELEKVRQQLQDEVREVSTQLLEERKKRETQEALARRLQKRVLLLTKIFLAKSTVWVTFETIVFQVSNVAQHHLLVGSATQWTLELSAARSGVELTLPFREKAGPVCRLFGRISSAEDGAQPVRPVLLLACLSLEEEIGHEELWGSSQISEAERDGMRAILGSYDSELTQAEYSPQLTRRMREAEDMVQKVHAHSSEMEVSILCFLTGVDVASHVWVNPDEDSRLQGESACLWRDCCQDWNLTVLVLLPFSWLPSSTAECGLRRTSAWRQLSYS